MGRSTPVGRLPRSPSRGPALSLLLYGAARDSVKSVRAVFSLARKYLRMNRKIRSADHGPHGLRPPSRGTKSRSRPHHDPGAHSATAPSPPVAPSATARGARASSAGARRPPSEGQKMRLESRVTGVASSRVPSPAGSPAMSAKAKPMRRARSRRSGRASRLRRSTRQDPDETPREADPKSPREETAVAPLRKPFADTSAAPCAPRATPPLRPKNQRDTPCTRRNRRTKRCAPRADPPGIRPIPGARVLAFALAVLAARSGRHEHGRPAQHHAAAEQHQGYRPRHPHERNVRPPGR